MRRDSTPGSMRAALVALAVGTVMIATGCSGLTGPPASVALSEEQGIPADAPIVEPWNDPQWSGEPLGWVSDGGETLSVVTFGSSSCPYIAVRIEVLTVRQLAIFFQKGPAEACTDDLAPRTHVFAVPEGLDALSNGLEAEVSLADNAFGDAEPTVVSMPFLPIGATAPLEPPAPAVESIALEVVRGTPADIVLDDSDLDRGTPLAFWGDDRATIRVVTWGSSSCPPIARSLSPAEPGIVVLDFAPNPAEFCTADFAPTTHVLETPGEVDTDDLALAVLISAADGSAEEFAVRIRD